MFSVGKQPDFRKHKVGYYQTPCDAFVQSLQEGTPLRSNIISPADACKDLKNLIK